MDYQSFASRPETTPDTAPPMGQFYDIGGRRLLLHRSGTGSPAVIFVPGAGLVGLSYLNIHDQAAALSTSVIYDRAGTGWSDDVDLPRTATATAEELRELLRAAEIAAPYLLVGHSLGGIYVRRYAQLFPDEVAGLLLLDPGHEDYPAYMPEQLLDAQGQMQTVSVEEFPEPDEQLILLYRGLFTQMYAGWPEALRDALIAYHLRAWRTGLREGNLNQLLDELRHGGDMPDVPLIVLTAMGVDAFQQVLMPDEPLLREMNDGKRRLFDAFVASLPHGEHRLLEGAGHSTIHINRSDAVVQAIRDLLDRIRK